MINEQKIGMVILNYNDSETVKAYYQLIKQYQSIDPVSYTHLDVYKRQLLSWGMLGDLLIRKTMNF